jgi:serine/threonine-protein kinase RsbW
VPDPTLDENLEKPHGRGVMLMRTYMNEVSFNATGNCVTLVKFRSPAAADRKASSQR